MPDILYYAIVAVAGVVVGALLAGVILGLRARQQLAEERQSRAVAEEKNFRIPKLESAISRKNTEIKDLQEHLSDREQRLSEIQNRLSQRDRELFEKSAQLAEKTVELSETRANLAAKRAELEEERRYSAAKLAEQKRLSRERLEGLYEAQTQIWHDFRQLFAEALLEDQPQYPKLVRNGQEITEDMQEPQESPPEDLWQENLAEEEQYNATAGNDIKQTPREPEEDEDQEEGEDPLAGFPLEDKDSETIELNLVEDDKEAIQETEPTAEIRTGPPPIPIREIISREKGSQQAEDSLIEAEKKNSRRFRIRYRTRSRRKSVRTGSGLSDVAPWKLGRERGACLVHDK
ncbi:MAG: hypothetical protein JW828_03515 [Sedimentisphaerales bacterium]|nr:hypothetical protein [Sedimentisphaerales bacterium]